MSDKLLYHVKLKFHLFIKPGQYQVGFTSPGNRHEESKGSLYFPNTRAAW